MSRPNKYELFVEPYLDKIKEMALTMTEEQIANELKISLSTWKRYKADHEPLRSVLKDGRRDLVSELRGALIKKAKGYDYTESKVITEEVKWPEELYVQLVEAGFTPEQIERSKTVRTEVYHKKAAPDVAAINLALKNYDSENWSNDPQMLKIREKELELKERQIENNEW